MSLRVVLSALLTVMICFQYAPSYASQIAWLVVEHSPAYQVFQPWDREVMFAATEALDWEVADYRETILTYYELLYDAVLHNEMDKAARYLGVLLTLLLRAKGYTEASGPRLLPLFESLDWGSARILDTSPEEIVDYWLLYEPSSDEDFAYASVSLSLLGKLPVNSFIRVLHTPLLREMYIASFAAILAASTYFSYRRGKLEGGRVEAEAPP